MILPAATFGISIWPATCASTRVRQRHPLDLAVWRAIPDLPQDHRLLIPVSACNHAPHVPNIRLTDDLFHV